MKKTATLATLPLLVAVAGRGEGGSPTIADSDNLGKEIVEALAQIPAKSPADSWMVPNRSPAPLDLSDVSIRSGGWNSIGDPELREAVAKYAKRAFPGILMECPEYCRPFSLDGADGATVLPSEGLLTFAPTPHPHMISATHYVVSRQGDGMVIDRAWYTVQMEGQGNGGWKVGKTMWGCCT